MSRQASGVGKVGKMGTKRMIERKMDSLNTGYSEEMNGTIGREEKGGNE